MLAWLVSSCMVEEEMYRGSSYGYSPYVKTGDVSEISRNSAVVKGALDIENLTGYHEYGILWSINYNSGELEYDGTRTPVIGEGNNPSSFQVELTDLNSMTTYYYCTYVEMPDGPIYGRVKNFVTLPAETPKLMFPEAFGKDDSGFSVRSAFENWDGQSSFETGFCWKKVGSDYTEPTLESCDRLEYCDSTTPFQTRVDVYWSEASLYAVRAFVRLYATDEIVYSSTLYVSQDDNPLLSPCIVEAIDGNTVSFHAMACNFDRLAITEKGFCYSETSSAPTIEANTKVSDITSEEITEITATIEGLNPDQFYYVRAYCVADGMTYYGPTYIYGKRDAGIYTLEDLVAFRDARNNNEDVSMWKNEEGVINLYSDIDMGSIENWIPIKSIEYGETFNGNKHTLDNMKITAFEADYNSSNLGFIEYNNGTVSTSKIHSIFDYLYEQYTDARIAYLKKHKKISEYDSENLTFALLEDILKENINMRHLNIICHLPLYMLIQDYSLLNEEESKYAANINTHIDFLIYNRVSKQPVLAIETDGYTFHKSGTSQSERDIKKDHILELYGIPLVRLSTIGSNEKKIIGDKLSEVLNLH